MKLILGLWINGRWREYEGGITDWQAQAKVMASLVAPEQPVAPARSEPAPVSRSVSAEPAKARSKLSYKEQRELESLPGLIEALETEQKGIAGQLADGSLYATQPAQATALAQRSGEIDDALLAAMERWETLGAGAA